MKKILLLLILLSSFLLAYEPPAVITYNGITFYKSVKISSNTNACNKIVDGEARGLVDNYKISGIYYNYNKPFLKVNTQHSPFSCSSQFMSYYYDSWEYTSEEPKEPEPIVCDLDNGMYPFGDTCIDCSHANQYAETYFKCACNALGDDFNGFAITVKEGYAQDNGKCYYYDARECIGQAVAVRFTPVSCDGIGNETIPDDNSTIPDDNETIPDDNSTIGTGNNTNNNSTGGDGNSTDGNSTGTGGDGEGGNGNGNGNGTIGEGNSTDDNATDDCWWCGDGDTVDSIKLGEFVTNELNNAIKPIKDIMSMIEGDNLAFNLPSSTGGCSSDFNIFGKTLSFNMCSHIGVLSPVIQLIIMICGYVLAIRIFLGGMK